MALHTKLPIYKSAYDLLMLVLKLAKNMNRDFKVQVGGELRTECVKIVLCIFHANVESNKVPHLNTLIERLQVVELTLRLARDLQIISTGQYSDAIELSGSVGKQAMGWRRSASRPLPGGQGSHD